MQVILNYIIVIFKSSTIKDNLNRFLKDMNDAVNEAKAFSKDLEL